MSNKNNFDKDYLEFIEKIVECENYSKKYYKKHKNKMREYQRRYLKEVRLGVRKPKKIVDSYGDGVIKISYKPVIITFD